MLAIVSAASAPGSDAVPNEDWYGSGEGWAVVLDGVTRPPGDGCRHDVPWFVAALGQALTQELSAGRWGLDLVVADAIREVAALHEDTCDLANPLTPAAQVAILRHRGDDVEYLVLGDATLVWQAAADAAPVVVCDDRADHLPAAPEPVMIGGARRYPLEYVASVRNRPGGYFVAAADPGAATEALRGTFPASPGARAALCSDGLTRLVGWYGWTWEGLVDAATTDGMPALIDTVHQADRDHPATSLRGKTSDDATGVLLVLD
ncbi:protein phosphatase 2C domain-containing protein [Glycomyces sp. A-F 0318]|uniref:protein phosphatase 2C domain-containing protein n=1 Tax=Glycomyces amatae TaxID=2881355 RepID=UPI001E3B1226|nr:protein phosphatase 2C domain-containing protein [Glycomyces amatae]MCD0445913.1 protein phosphatase 2C domain-containing protein [Glycomyces amatae]